MEEPMKRTLLYAIVGAVIAAAVVAAGTAIWFVAGHRETAHVSASVAEVEFARIRSRFSHQQPLVDMSVRQPAAPLPAATPAQPLRTFHTVIFDTRGGERIVRISVPYWVARHYARHDGYFRWLGELTFLDDTEFDPEAIWVSLDQLERRGPGLVVDYRRPSGGQFVSWIE
jgi:flagellar basal body-associated protein FliL